MGFSSQQYKRGSQDRPWKVNPVWRGIGCILILIIPIMSWFATTIILRSNLRQLFPREFYTVYFVPFSHIPEVDKVITQVNQYLLSSKLVFGQVFLTIILSVIGFGILAFVYAILYRLAGPPRYGPFDVPPNKI
jgi:hypothetical protein